MPMSQGPDGDSSSRATEMVNEIQDNVAAADADSRDAGAAMSERDGEPPRAVVPESVTTPEKDPYATVAVVWLVRQYQWWLSPILGGRCRFYPSCSEYAIGAVRKYGVIRGCWRSFCRICRCHPFHPGGVDYP